MIVMSVFIFTSVVEADEGVGNDGTGMVYDGQYSDFEEPALASSPLTPDGQGTVLERTTGTDNLEVITITTRYGSVFFLVIDHRRENNNVFFLNTVTEFDLIALAEAAGAQPPPQPQIVSPEFTPEPELPPSVTSYYQAASQPEPETPPQETSNGNWGALVFSLVVVVIVGGVGYYVKILGPRKQRRTVDEADDDDEDNYEDVDEEEVP